VVDAAVGGELLDGVHRPAARRALLRGAAPRPRHRPFAVAAFLLKLCGNHDLVGDPGVAIFVAFASLAHAMLAVTLGPSFPHLFKTVYEPKFFEAHLSLSDKITAWRTQPVASLQLVTIVLLLSVMAVVTASVG